MEREASIQANTPLAVFLSYSSQDPEAMTNAGRRRSVDGPVVK